MTDPLALLERIVNEVATPPITGTHVAARVAVREDRAAILAALRSDADLRAVLDAASWPLSESAWEVRRIAIVLSAEGYDENAAWLKRLADRMDGAAPAPPDGSTEAGVIIPKCGHGNPEALCEQCVAEEHAMLVELGIAPPATPATPAGTRNCDAANGCQAPECGPAPADHPEGCAEFAAPTPGTTATPNHFPDAKEMVAAVTLAERVRGLKRWHLFINDNDIISVVEMASGDWVKRSDVEALAARLVAGEQKPEGETK